MRLLFFKIFRKLCLSLGSLEPWPHHLRFSASFDNDLGVMLAKSFGFPLRTSSLRYKCYHLLEIECSLPIHCSAYIHIVQVVLHSSCSLRCENFQAVLSFFSDVIHEDEPGCRLPFEGMDEGYLFGRYRKAVCR
jgi:hypothetical protein